MQTGSSIRIPCTSINFPRTAGQGSEHTVVVVVVVAVVVFVADAVCESQGRLTLWPQPKIMLQHTE